MSGEVSSKPQYVHKEDRSFYYAHIVLVIILVLVALGLLLLQCLFWLKQGYWAPLPLKDLAEPLGLKGVTFSWRGIQRMYDYVMEGSAVVDLLVTATIIGFISPIFIERRWVEVPGSQTSK